MRHAAKSYLSTLAVLQLDLILKNAYQVGEPVPPKAGIKNQSEFSEMIIMECLWLASELQNLPSV